LRQLVGDAVPVGISRPEALDCLHAEVLRHGRDGE
jgi:hypothetical protein